MKSRSLMAALALGLGCSGAAIAFDGGAAATPSPKPVSPSGSFALSGAEAAAYLLPADLKETRTLPLSGGRTQTRYQQYVDGAAVAGAQVTVIRNASGVARAVVGAHVDGLSAVNDKVLTGAQARAVVRGKIGGRGHWSSSYQIDPRNGRTFFAVESIRSNSRPVRWVDAQSGRIVKAYDALAHGSGTGVLGDTKTVDSTLNATTGRYELRSSDGRRVTYDNQNRTGTATTTLMTDADDVWNLAGTTSPGQAAGVDAHFYADVVDDFYGTVFGRNSIDGNGIVIKSRVHYDNRLCNASWNGEWMSYGDGDGRTCLSLAGSLDVVGHELTHGVTDYTSDLIYENQSGALNESFSDQMGNSMEFWGDARDPGSPDWLIGEDTVNQRGDATRGFRNMADPGQDGDPDHMVDLYTGTADSGGVHTNSGIPNHAYYLAVNGGQNRGCVAGQWRTAPTHTEDCDVSVPAIGLAASEQVFYDGFTSLNAWANFCDARNSTVAVAPRSAKSAVGLAWDAVGVHAGCTGGVAPPPPCVGDDTATLPFGTPDGYNEGVAKCTWTYDNGSPGFAFHFSVLATEQDFDYVHVMDAAGNVLATYTGLYRRGVTSPCIPTSTGSVQLDVDPFVSDQGFIVDAVVDC